ncbi:tyrosine-type recombinase/integrase [Marinicella sp. W31]|uniref:tyrosine-type recombinase/integrase n=1 Tax=Marinicella sp. W31 TaxID=3023713 RepID=UPI003756BD2D
MNLQITQNLQLPVLISHTPEKTQKKFLEFFVANYRNKNTRQAYFRNCCQFLDWAANRNLILHDLEPLHCAAYIENLSQQISAPSVKQHSSAIKMLFDWLVVNQCVTVNPMAGVKPPKHSYQEGRTPILTAKQARQLFDSIDGDRLIDYRDRALISAMLFSFSRVSAALAMKVKDYLINGSDRFFQLLEKGGKTKKVPVHHLAARYIEEYIHKADLADQPSTPLFRSFYQGGKKIKEKQLNRVNAWNMVKRRVKQAGLSSQVTNHSFRGTGITNFLENDGDLETAAWIAGHTDVRTTKLYDRRKQVITQSEIERIRI